MFVTYKYVNGELILQNVFVNKVTRRTGIFLGEFSLWEMVVNFGPAALFGVFLLLHIYAGERSDPRSPAASP